MIYRRDTVYRVSTDDDPDLQPQRTGRTGIFPFTIILITIALIVMVLDVRGVINTPLGEIEAPLANMTDRFRGLTNAIRLQQYGWQGLDDVYATLAQLEAEKDALERENETLRDLQAENLRLEALLDYTQQTPQLSRVTANVMGRGADPTFHDIIIDRGHDDGVAVGMPVDSIRGMVGQVVRTTPHTAQILLLTDNATRIPALLQQARGLGMINGGEPGGLLTLQEIELEAQLSQNELVVTAGRTGNSNEELITNRFPPDMIIGRVIEIRKGTAELYQTAVVQPVVDFDTLETVFVVTDFEPVDPSVFYDE